MFEYVTIIFKGGSEKTICVESFEFDPDSGNFGFKFKDNDEQVIYLDTDEIVMITTNKFGAVN